VTSVFDDTHRADPAHPVILTPEAAAKGVPASEDGAGFDFSIFVSVGAQLGSLVDGLEADREHRRSMIPPSNEQLFADGLMPSSGNLILDLGSVPLGRVWQVRRLIVGGVAVTTAATGKAYAFAQGAPPRDLNLTNGVGIYAALPAIDKWGTHQLFLLATEHLWVVIAGGSSGQQYTASARVEDWDDATFRSTFAE
jgi:hypothetical protein